MSQSTEAVALSSTRHARSADAEFHLPSAIGKLVRSGIVRVKVLPSREAWCGVTHRQDSAAVAERIERYAGVVGRERVIAGTDCGFGTSAWGRKVPASIVWAKLRSLVEGAQLASTSLRA